MTRGKRTRTSAGPASGRRRGPGVWPFVLAVVLVAAAGAGFLYARVRTDAERTGPSAEQVPVGSQPEQDAAPGRLDGLVGRWLRPDGGYVIDIQRVNPDGTLQAAYFNPSSIHVAQARAVEKNGQVILFIELRDVGYPGATYDLVFNPNHDAMMGRYFQPTAGRYFDVVFTRQK